jgi:hypothetical protein
MHKRWISRKKTKLIGYQGYYFDREIDNKHGSKNVIYARNNLCRIGKQILQKPYPTSPFKKKSKNEPTLIFTLMGNGERDKGYLIISSMLKNVL